MIIPSCTTDSSVRSATVCPCHRQFSVSLRRSRSHDPGHVPACRGRQKPLPRIHTDISVQRTEPTGTLIGCPCSRDRQAMRAARVAPISAFSARRPHPSQLIDALKKGGGGFSQKNPPQEKEKRNRKREKEKKREERRKKKYIRYSKQIGMERRSLVLSPSLTSWD